MNQLTAYTLRLGDNCLVPISHWQTLASIY